MKPITAYTDRELLELCAAYCGVAVVPYKNRWNESYPLGWNPLTDAGDRERMCDELRITVAHWGNDVRAFELGPDFRHSEKFSAHNNSRITAANYAAVRLVATMQLAKQEVLK